MHDARDQPTTNDSDRQHQPVRLRFRHERDEARARPPNRERRDVVERHGSFGEVHPVERHHAHYFGKADGDDHEIGAAHPERELPYEKAEQTADHDRSAERNPYRLRLDHERIRQADVHVEAKREQRAGVGADAEKRRVAEAQLPGVAEQQVEADRRDDENAGRGEDGEVVGLAHPQRQARRQHDKQQSAEPRAHPTRPLSAKKPWGRSASTAMITRKPSASRYSLERYPAPNSSTSASTKPPMVAPPTFPSPPRITMAKALSPTRLPMVGLTRKIGPSSAPAMAASAEPSAKVSV